jgi:hypothetical protein
MARTRIRNPFLPASVASANSVVRLRSSYALPLLAFSLSLAMVIFLGWTSGRLPEVVQIFPLGCAFQGSIAPLTFTTRGRRFKTCVA